MSETASHKETNIDLCIREVMTISLRKRHFGDDSLEQKCIEVDTNMISIFVFERIRPRGCYQQSSRPIFMVWL